MQKGYNEIQSIEIELRILEQTSAPPSRPREYQYSLKYDDDHISSHVVNKPETENTLKTCTSVRIKRVRFVDETYE
jgi:hypothetical protein